MKTAQSPLIAAFGTRMRQRREMLGLHKQVLAEAVGLSLTTIQQYENGQMPKGSHAVRLAEALDCSLDWLLAGRGDCGGRRQDYRRGLPREVRAGPCRGERFRLGASRRRAAAAWRHALCEP